MVAEPERRAAALTAVNAAEVAFEASADAPATITATWMQLQRARAALYGVERSRERAMEILGKPNREPKVPAASYGADVDRLLNAWARQQLGAANEAAHEDLAQVTAGKVSHDAK